MASTVMRLSLADLAGWYKLLGPRLNKAARRGAIRGAFRALSTVQRAVGKAPPANPAGIGTGGAFNTGYYKRAWKAEGTTYGARLYNAAKYAGVIEKGRRPGTFPPTTAIRDWAQRRLGLTREEAQRAAFPIARAIAKRGLMARNVMADQIPTIEKDFTVEVEKELNRELLIVQRGGK